MVKIYPSSIAKVQGASVTGYNKSCLRYQLIADQLPKTDIPILYKNIGYLGEVRKCAELFEQFPDDNVKLEVPLSADMGNDIFISGRADAINYTKKIVYEFKATVSRAKYTSLIRKREIVFEHLAQLCTYLAILNYTEGEIHASYIHYSKDRLSLKFEDVVFKITLVGDTIEIDGIKSEISLNDVFQYYRLVKYAHVGTELPPAILSEYACLKCPVQDICEKRTKQEFYRLITVDGFKEIPETSSPKINTHDTRELK